jgi:succinate-semialdehyde dehydrogenase/glutarate-semialdehyde dehydrogenase
MLARKLAPALAAGCSAVVKPAEDTPLSALRLAEVAREAGVPEHVVEVVTCGRESVSAVGSALMRDARVRKVSFTGSTAVGTRLASEAAATAKRVSLEMGGDAPFIVFDDADVPEAVNAAVVSKFRNAGQTCVCANRLLVQEGVYDAFVKALGDRVSKLVLGHGTDPRVQVGPLINDRAVEKVCGMVDDALARGAKLVGGTGRRTAFATPSTPNSALDPSAHASLSPSAPLHADPARSLFVSPALLVDVDPDMRVMREEIFGPVAPVMRFRDAHEAVAIANRSSAGLGGYVFTRDLKRAWTVAEALELGMVGINTGSISSAVAPFGGVKMSGYGREGAALGLDEYLVHKYIAFAGMA